MRPWFNFWFRHYIHVYCFLVHIVCFSSYPFLHFFRTYLLPYLPFLFRIDPLHFQAGCLRRRLKLALVFVFILCCSTFLLIGECVLFVLGLVFFILSQEFCWGTRLWNDLFCVEWGVKPQLSQSLTIHLTLVCFVNSSICWLIGFVHAWLLPA